MKQKYYIFDMDGTLTETMGYWRNLAKEVFESDFNIKISAEMSEKLMEANTADAIETIKENFNIVCETSQIQQRMLEILYSNYENKTPVKDGLIEFLEKSKKNGVKMCVASASPNRHVETALKQAKIFDYFEFIITIYDVDIGKTSPKIYLTAMQKLGGTKENTLIFEDAAYAVRTAKKEGFYVVGIEDYFSRKDKEEIISLVDEYHKSYKELI